MTPQKLMIHSHRGEDGATVLAEAGPGDVVRRIGYRRHWFIESNDGQTVLVYAKRGTGEMRVHASELTLISKAKK